MFRNTIMDKVEVRVAKGLTFDEMNGEPGDPDSALWARVPGHLTPSAATLAIFGDYVSGSASQALGRRSMGRSLDKTQEGELLATASQSFVVRLWPGDDGAPE
jgi:hypothetical protein